MGLFPFTFASAAVRPATIDRVKALMWGLVWFIFATIFIWYFRTVPTSTVTVDVSGYVPLSTVLLLHAAVWGVSGAVVYALAAVVGESVGLVETLSRVLFARAPIYLLLAPLAWRGFRVPLTVLVHRPAEAVSSYPGVVMPYLAAVAAVGVWYVWWNYTAFAAAAHRKGGKVVAAFVAAMIASCWATHIVLDALAGKLVWNG